MLSPERLPAPCFGALDKSRNQLAHGHPQSYLVIWGFYVKEVMLILEYADGIVMTFLTFQTTSGTMMLRCLWRTA